MNKVDKMLTQIRGIVSDEKKRVSVAFLERENEGHRLDIQLWAGATGDCDCITSYHDTKDEAMAEFHRVVEEVGEYKGSSRVVHIMYDDIEE